MLFESDAIADNQPTSSNIDRKHRLR